MRLRKRRTCCIATSTMFGHRFTLLLLVLCPFVFSDDCAQNCFVSLKSEMASSIKSGRQYCDDVRNFETCIGGCPNQELELDDEVQRKFSGLRQHCAKPPKQSELDACVDTCLEAFSGTVNDPEMNVSAFCQGLTTHKKCVEECPDAAKHTWVWHLVDQPKLKAMGAYCGKGWRKQRS